MYENKSLVAGRDEGAASSLYNSKSAESMRSFEDLTRGLLYEGNSEAVNRKK